MRAPDWFERSPYSSEAECTRAEEESWKLLLSSCRLLEPRLDGSQGDTCTRLTERAHALVQPQYVFNAKFRKPWSCQAGRRLVAAGRERMAELSECSKSVSIPLQQYALQTQRVKTLQV